MTTAASDGRQVSAYCLLCHADVTAGGWEAHAAGVAHIAAVLNQIEGGRDVVTVGLPADLSLEARVTRLQQQLSEGLNTVQAAGAMLLQLGRELAVADEARAREERLRVDMRDRVVTVLQGAHDALQLTSAHAVTREVAELLDELKG